eukprot:1146063-Pelagomonas_calceolata.AAC.18
MKSRGSSSTASVFAFPESFQAACAGWSGGTCSIRWLVLGEERVVGHALYVGCFFLVHNGGPLSSGHVTVTNRYSDHCWEGGDH